jgi:hypothetical protein
MMKEEFDKLVGFETRYSEYQEIEREYMGTDQDKVKFAANWKKNDGIARLSRMRTRIIKELEAHLRVIERNYETSRGLFSETENKLIAERDELQENLRCLESNYSEVCKQKERVDQKLARLDEARRILFEIEK